MIHLENWGWNAFFQNHFESHIQKDYTAARVVAEHKHMYKLQTEQGEVLGEISGKMLHNAEAQGDFPAVGDWVAVSLRGDEKRATIHGIFPRRSKFSRKAVGGTLREQIMAANIDTVFLVTALNGDFNIRRIERYLLVAWESGAAPVIVLSKADLCDDTEEKVQQVENSALGVPIHVISSFEGTGMDALKHYLKKGSTIALLGSSGVGKSTIINYFIGTEVQKVNTIREGDDKGRHTSTHREIFLLPEGGLIVDTPGIREIQVWDGDEGISEAFEDIEALAQGCAFKDCRHEKEPNCAIREAIQSGVLSEGRFESYKKLEKELRFIEQKQNRAARVVEKKKQRSKGPRANRVRVNEAYDY